MIAKGLFALLSIASAVAAQSTAGIPQCLLTCSQKSCPDLTDLTCICVTHLTDITACALSSCSQADLATASTVAAQQCGIFPHNIFTDFPAAVGSSSIGGTSASALSQSVESLGNFPDSVIKNTR